MGCSEEEEEVRKRRRWVSGVRVTFITKICRVDRRCEPSKTDKSLSQTCRKSDVCVHISYTQGDSQPFQQTVFISFLFGLIFPQHDLLLFGSSVTWCWDNTNVRYTAVSIRCRIRQLHFPSVDCAA